MDEKNFKKEDNIICIYNEQGKNIEQLLIDIFTNLISEEIHKEVRFYEWYII